MKTPFRETILRAITASDSQSPFVSPTQLADALATLMHELTGLLNIRPNKEYVSKEELKRLFNLSEYRCNNILRRYKIHSKSTPAGRIFYNAEQFASAAAAFQTN